MKVNPSISKAIFPWKCLPVRFSTHVEKSLEAMSKRSLVSSDEVIVSTGGSSATIGIAIHRQGVTALKHALCRPESFDSQRQAVFVRHAERSEQAGRCRYAFSYKGACPAFGIILEAAVDAQLTYVRLFGVGLKLDLERSSQPSGWQLLKFLCTPGVCLSECAADGWPRFPDTPLIDVALKLDYHGMLPVFAASEQKPEVVKAHHKFYGLYGEPRHGTVKAVINQPIATAAAESYCSQNRKQGTDPQLRANIHRFLNVVEDAQATGSMNDTAMKNALLFGIHSVTAYNGDMKSNLNTFFLHRFDLMLQNTGDQNGFGQALDCVEKALLATKRAQEEGLVSCRFEVTFTRLLSSPQEYIRYCQCLWVCRESLLGIQMVMHVYRELNLELCPVRPSILNDSTLLCACALDEAAQGSSADPCNRQKYLSPRCLNGLVRRITTSQAGRLLTTVRKRSASYGFSSS